MNLTLAPHVGATPLREPKLPAPPPPPRYWGRSVALLKTTGKRLTQSGMLAFLAPLLQAEIGIHVWVTVAVVVVLYVLGLWYFVRHPRIHMWFCTTALVFSFLLLLTLAVRPFYHMTGRTYVTTIEEGHSVFDLQRYVSAKVALPEGSRLVVANHPVHWGMAWFLEKLLPAKPQEGEGGLMRWARQLAAGHFDGRIICLTPEERRGGSVVSLELTTRQREGWTDLSGASCTSYALTFGEANAASFSLSLISQGQGKDGSTRIGTRLQVDLTSDEASKKMSFHLRSTPESIHWEDVVLYGGYDVRSATYVSLLAELLASSNLRHYWAEHSAELWQKAPNEREMLRLLLLKVRLDSITSKGNVLHAQLLPDLIRAETILAGRATAPESLAQDQLLYWAAKNFVQLNKGAVHRFERTVASLKESLAAAAHAVEPTFFEGSKDSAGDLTKLLSRMMPLNVWRLPGTQRYLAGLEPEAERLKTSLQEDKERPPVNKTLAWLRQADWDRLKKDIPQMQLKRAAPGRAKDVKTAAAHAQEPTLEEAWDNAEQAFGLEYIRRVLQKALGETNEHILNARGVMNEAVLRDVAEALLQQRALIEELLALRQTLWGDSAAYLADSTILATLRAAAQHYASSSAADADISRLPGIAGWIQFLGRAAQQPVVRTILGLTGEELEFGSMLAEPLAWLKSEPRLARAIMALLSAVQARPAALDDIIEQSRPLQAWLIRVSQDPSIPPLLLRLLEDKAAQPQFFSKLQEHAATIPAPAPVRTNLRHIIEDLVPIMDALRQIDPEKPVNEQPVIAELAGHGMIFLRDMCYNTGLLYEVGALIDRSVFTQDFTAFDIFAPQADGPAREFYERMRAAARTRAKDRRDTSIQTAEEKRIWLFINRITTLSNLPEDQQPQVLLRHPESGRTTFLPACPMLEDWIREVITASSDPVAKTAYPCVAEVLYLDLYLRTLQDETHAGYTSTELGMLRQIFRSITKQSIEDYLADCFESEAKSTAP